MEGIHNLKLAITQMLWHRIVAAVHIRDEATHCPDPQVLQTVLFGGKVGIDLGMTWNPAAVLAKHVVAEKILCVARRTCTHRDKEKVRVFRNRLSDRVGHSLDFSGEGPSLIQCLALLPDKLRGFQRLAHRLEATRPGAF